MPTPELVTLLFPLLAKKYIPFHSQFIPISLPLHSHFISIFISIFIPISFPFHSHLIPISFQFHSHFIPFHHVLIIIQVWVFDHPYLGVYFLSIYIHPYAPISTLGHAYFHRQWRNQDGHQPRGGYLLSNHIHCLRFIFPELWPPSQSSLHTRCCHLDHCRSSQVDHGILIQGWLSNAHFHR